MKTISRNEAIIRLTNRWHEECLLYPLMRDSIPLADYVRVNSPIVMRRGLLESYKTVERTEE